MRVTIAHNQSKDEVIRAVDRSFDDIFRGAVPVPIQIFDQKRTWTGATLDFSFIAKWGILSAPIKGTVEVTERDVTIDADLGLLEKLFPGQRAQSAIAGTIRGLLR